MRNPEILERGKRADCGRDQVIGNKQKCADDGDNFGTMTDAGIDAAAVRIEAADDDVVNSDERSENAHRPNQPERRVAADRERETDDVRFDRAPVPVQNGSRARDINVARSLNISCYQLL